MTEEERYEFDRNGYVVIEEMLTAGEVASLKAAVDRLEEHAAARVDKPPRKRSAWGAEYHADEDLGYHERTLEYVGAAVMQRPTVNNSEIRIRYRGNASPHHGGSRGEDQKYRYNFASERIDCMMVRMIYFLHDNDAEGGAFTVVPGTHKSNLPSPYGNDPDSEPGTVALEVKAGWGIFFTEALRHGGRTNRSDRVRKTIHVGYGPYWMPSQNMATMDEPPFVTKATHARWSEEQRQLFRSWPEAWE